ncbi:hypothetical protein CTEN210_13709 [Chaetoceros tenuissimus]|uniref:Leucine-rich repeat domain-containing protein n=1 Tax=Chaetoceros tenuissimus TaxID=426638 RepID=A0AAD3D3S0_9STRA|nr:hypothetical protein CTEN210_13709 [Chaetoceros tenuissimus]
MRVATVDGLVTLVYDGSEPLWNRELRDEWLHGYSDHDFNEEGWEEWNVPDACKRYWRERQSWQQIIVVEGVTEIPDGTFCYCFNIKRVIFADTVIRIGLGAFFRCKSLAFIKWSINIEIIEQSSFSFCDLSSVFLPPRCREVLFDGTWKFLAADPGLDVWLKNINDYDEFALHRVCCSFEPTLEMILDTMKEKGGPKAFKVENSIGITPSRYLKENPYADVKEKDIIEKYVLDMMGESI